MIVKSFAGRERLCSIRTKLTNQQVKRRNTNYMRKTLTIEEEDEQEELFGD